MSIKWKKKNQTQTKHVSRVGHFLLYEILLGARSLTVPRQMLHNSLDISLITETLKIRLPEACGEKKSYRSVTHSKRYSSEVIAIFFCICKSKCAWLCTKAKN